MATTTYDATTGEGSTVERDGQVDTPELDLVFEVLRNRRRRLVLRFLGDHEETTQSELAEHVAAVENGVDREAITSKQRKRVYVALYQTHLPKLADAQAIDFDKHRGTVSRRPETADYVAYLERMSATEPTVEESRNTAIVGGLAGGAFGLTAALGVGGVLGGEAVIGAAIAAVAVIAGVVLTSRD